MTHGDRERPSYVFFGNAILVDRLAFADDVTFIGGVAGDAFGKALAGGR